MREDSDLDRLIDVVLGTYAEADSGLERRVLARVGAGRTLKPRFGRMVWAAGLAAAVCLLLIFVLVHPRLVHAPDMNARNTPTLQRRPETAVRATPPIMQRRSGSTRKLRPEHGAVTSLDAGLPKQEMFPMPRPLSPEERALAEFAARAPEAERESLIEAQIQSDEPIAIAAIRIEPIQIPPLESPEAGAN